RPRGGAGGGGGHRPARGPRPDHGRRRRDRPGPADRGGAARPGRYAGMSGRPAPRPSAAAGRAATGRRPGPGRTRRVAWRTVFFGLAAVRIVAGVAWALLGSRLLIVRSVQVTGAGQQVSRAQVLAAARIPAGLPLIRVNTAAVTQRVDGIRQVESAQV